MKDEFHSLEVREIRRETRDAISIGLVVPPALRDTFRYAPGQHIGVRAVIDGEEIRRTYSISGVPDDPRLWITIKRLPGGVFSSWAHANLKPGMHLDCMQPAGRFVLPPATTSRRDAARLYAIAAGSGITPVAGLVETWLARHPANRATLIFGNHSIDDIIFRERLEGLKNRNLQRLQIHHVLSRDAESDVPLLSGRIDAIKIEGLTRDARPADGDMALLCGPDTLIKTARDVFLAFGLPREAIRQEFFRAGPASSARPKPASPPLVTPATIARTAEVTAIHDGTRRTFQVAPGEHVIDAALAAGVKLPYSCKGGMCCTCRAYLVEGNVVMDRNFSLEAWEIEAGFVLTCQARPTTDQVVLDYDKV